jgi:DNA-binding transcriptional regulator GbsR (MarR family)
MTDDDAQLAFADQFGRHLSRQYGMPPIAGRVAGWLLICDPPDPTVAELADSLRASRTAVSGAVAALERMALVQRSRAAGERADRIAIDPAFGSQSLDDPAEYVALGALARPGP